jgi:beta-lactam-binding protein with PASTA domain
VFSPNGQDGRVRFRRPGPSEEATVVGPPPGAVVTEGPPPDGVVEEEVVPPGPPPRPLVWPWLLLLLALVIGGLVAAWLLTRDNGKKGASTVNVPNVVRLQQHEAVIRLNRRGLIARTVSRSSAAAPGVVVAQDPNPGADLVRHSVVTLTVPVAQKNAVPGVVGQRVASAVGELRSAGFRVRETGVVSEKPTGTVLAQAPQSGSRLAAGSTVTIRVSRGLVTVPNTVGRSRNDAVAAVRAAGLEPKAFIVPSTRPKGTVVAQKPLGGKRVPGGSAVRLNVSSGSTSPVPPPPPPPPAPPPPPPPTKPATVTVPDVTGQQQDAAQKALNASGLKAGVVYVPSDQPQGTVVSEAPDAGTTQKRNTRIQLNVSLGPKPGTLEGVPDVRNLGAAAARAKLAAAGFNVQTLRQGVSDLSQIGKVVDEQPAGGKNAPAGSVVTIYVGRAA